MSNPSNSTTYETARDLAWSSASNVSFYAERGMSREDKNELLNKGREFRRLLNSISKQQAEYFSKQTTKS